MFPEYYIGDFYEYVMSNKIDVHTNFIRGTSERTLSTTTSIEIDSKYYFVQNLEDSEFFMSYAQLEDLIMNGRAQTSYVTNVLNLLIILPKQRHHMIGSTRRRLLQITQGDHELKVKECLGEPVGREN